METVIVILVLLTLAYGVIEFGLLIRDSLALNNVAREAARIAAVGGTPDVDTLASQFGLSGSPSATITAPDEPGQQVVVDLTYTHSMITGLFGADKTLSTTMVMRRE